MDGYNQQVIPDSVLLKIIPENNKLDEEILLVQACKKVSRWGINQNRQVILSTHFIYLIDKTVRKQKISINELKYIVKSKKNDQFILYFLNEQDLCLVVKNKDEFINYLKLRFANFCPNTHLKVYGVPEDNLKQYRSNNVGNVQKALAFDCAPEEKYRLYDEEIQTQKEVDEQQNQFNQNMKVINENDFDFGGRSSIKVVQIDLNAKIGSTEQTKLPAGDSNTNDSIWIGDQDSLDNLADHFDEMMKNLNQDDKKNAKRKLTSDEEQELRSTTMVKRKKTIIDEKPVNFSDFTFLMVIGRGAFGKVFLAEMKTSKKLYAIKSIRKDILLEQGQVENTLLEKDIMLECDNPFLISMDYLFQNDLRLYFVMPFIRGGELYKVFQKEKRFKEDVVKFYAVQITIALGYLHMKGIVHRDLKLENILLDTDGFIKIIDYGLAKMLDDKQQANTFCGTPEYLAPEIIAETGHDKSVDWWALGIIMYEMLIGLTPFFNKNRNALFTKIQNSKVIFPDRKKYKIEYSDGIMEIIESLLNKDKSKRLGSKDDFVEILSHPYFQDVDIEALEKKSVIPPFKPNFGNKDFTQFFNTSQSQKEMGDTYIPRENRRIVDQNGDMFKDFDSKLKR